MSARDLAAWIAFIALVLFVTALLAMSGVRSPHPAPEPTPTHIQLETL